ncbi:MAG: DUF86 domain-containing protein [Candidatus Atribacteria bacterium]|nr:DUF86 domain-containing protein [Candidatus Atribacteria bacterium]
MKIDLEKIKHRFSDIHEALGEIEKLLSLPQEELLREKRNMAAVKYFLLQAIEAVGSICVHLCAKQFSRGVATLGECFEVLEEEGILGASLSERLKSMARFRNKLVHRYWEMDDQKICQHIQEGLKDFTDFMRAIEEFFERQGIL